jgi:DNA ligase-1
MYTAVDFNLKKCYLQKMLDGETIQFSEFASLCQKLEKLSSSNAMRDELAKFFKEVPPAAVKCSSYFLLGMIGPKYADIDLGIGDRTAMSIIARAFNVSKSDVESRFARLGDLGDVAQSFSKRESSSLKDDDVYDALHEFKSISGKGSRERKARLLSKLLQNASALEAKYIMRIALGSMRLGVGEMTVLNAFAQAFAGGLDSKSAVEDGYDVNTDIGSMGESMARHGLNGVRHLAVVLGRPVEMMLAQRVKAVSEILERFKGEQFAAEEKYDGERVQVHKNGDDIQLFSRRLENITSQYPDIAEYARAGTKAEKAVLDGEIIAFEKGRMLPFQKLMQRRRKHNVERYREKVPVVLVLFDIIYLEGKSLLKKSYPKRRKLLEDTFKESENAFLARRVVSSDFEDIKKFFKQSIDKGFEGIIVKATSEDSVYQPGKRGWMWIKWKREYAKGMEDTFDVVVVGSYHGKGRRKEVFGALLCAVYNKDDDAFETFTKVGTGFTDETFRTIKETLKKYRVQEKPKRLRLKKAMEPDEFYEPKVVIEIMGAEITRSPGHTAGEENGRGLALRFPRFLRIREDKGQDEVTTVEEIKSMLK